MRMIQRAIIWTGVIAVILTILPFIPSNEWWIRVWDFPRLQLAVILAAVLVATPFFASSRRLPTLLFMAVLTSTLAWQVYRIWPYTPAHTTEVKKVTSCQPDSQVRLLVANVMVANDHADPLLALVRRVEPNLLLLVETDFRWDRHLAPLKEHYPHVISRPQDNGYGMHLFSQLEMVGPEIRFLIDDYVPSIKTGIRLPSGAVIELYGVHPKPPPRQDTERRDAELLIVAREVRDGKAAAIVAGDLNDVGWSRTTGLFQEISGMLDPRVGRGMYSTFHAKWPIMRWPLDHVFVEDAFWLLNVRVMDYIGSDHFPFFAALCHSPAARVQDEPQAEPSDTNQASEAIREGRQSQDE